MVFAWQSNASRGYLADDLPVGIRAQGHKGPHLGEGGEVAILIGLQDRDDAAPFLVQAGEKFGGHPLPIHNHACHLTGLDALLIACQERRNSCGEMLVSPMGGDEKRMAVLVVQQEECPTTQNSTQAPNESTWEEHVTVDGEAQAVHIASQLMGRLGSLRFLRFFGRMPKLGGPAREGIREAFGTVGTGNLR